MGSRVVKPQDSRSPLSANDRDTPSGEETLRPRGGSVFSIGCNTNFQLGRSTVGVGVKTDSKQVDDKGELDRQCVVVSVAGGDSFSLALCDDGGVYLWGTTILSANVLKDRSEDNAFIGMRDNINDDDDRDEGEGKEEREIRPHGAKVSDVASKRQDRRRPGRANEDNRIIVRNPQRIGSSLSKVRVTCASAAGEHAIVVSDAGRIYSWGDGKDGALGHGTRKDENHPRGIEHLDPHFVVTCATGAHHTICITVDGNVFLWGFGLFGQLGFGERKDALIPRLCKLLAAQKRVAANENDDDDDDGRKEEVRHDIVESRAVTAACGEHHTLVVYGDGDVYSFGSGRCGALGHGSERSALTPRRIERLLPHRVCAVAAGGAHSFAITDIGELFAWGRGGIHGVTGLGEEGTGGGGGKGGTLESKQQSKNTDALYPKRVPIVGSGGRQVPVRYVSTSKPGHTLVVDVEGRVWGFGYNGFRQLMAPPVNRRDDDVAVLRHDSVALPSWCVPRLVPDLTQTRTRRVVFASAGSLHSLFVVAMTDDEIRARHERQEAVLARNMRRYLARKRARRENRRLLQEEREFEFEEQQMMKRALAETHLRGKTRDLLDVSINDSFAAVATTVAESVNEKAVAVRGERRFRRPRGRGRHRRRRRRRRRDPFEGGEDLHTASEEEDVPDGVDIDGNVLRARGIGDFFSPRKEDEGVATFSAPNSLGIVGQEGVVSRRNFLFRRKQSGVG